MLNHNDNSENDSKNEDSPQGIISPRQRFVFRFTPALTSPQRTEYHLNTLVTSFKGVKYPVVAVVSPQGSGVFSAEVKLNFGTVNEVTLGNIALFVKQNVQSIIPPHNFTPGYVFIGNMENMTNKLKKESRYKHVGNALHETAFRFSIAQGVEGRVKLMAIEESHSFHYKNGFVIDNDPPNNSCKQLTIEAKKNREKKYYEKINKSLRNGRVKGNSVPPMYLHLNDRTIAAKKLFFNTTSSQEEKVFCERILAEEPDIDYLAKYKKPSTSSRLLSFCFPLFNHTSSQKEDKDNVEPANGQEILRPSGLG